MKNEEVKEAIAKYLESKELVFWSYPAEYIEDVKTDVGVAFRKGAEWMTGQGATMEITDDTEWADLDSFVHKNVTGGSIIQIRKK